MKSALLAATLLAAGLAPAGAQSLFESHDNTYVEPERPRDGVLIIEHAPVPVNPIGRRNGRGSAIAGGCRDASIVERTTVDGQRLVLQREACDSIAPRTSAPGQSDPRPVLPEAPALRTRG
jgi:hypothetical protein